jgi:dimethylglycine dehydrogenase
MYVLRVPGEERPAGRPNRTSPLYEKLKEKGAVYTETFGWERPKWFSLDGRKEEWSFRRNNSFEVVAEECRAVRERVGVLDLSSFTKHDVTGPDAEVFLNRVLANRISRRKCGIILTHGLTDKGRIESEYTITRLDDEHFYLLSAAAAELRNTDQLLQRKQDNEQVTIKNITEEWGTLVLAGPRSRELLAKITNADLCNEHFPWLTGKEIEIAGVMMRALRINYVGELGWELHIPIDQLVNVYDSVWAAGEEFGIADFGMYTLSSLGKEKAYYAWGVELINEITMIEAGMERFVNFKKGDFVGREALLQRQKEQLDWNIAYVEVDAEDAEVCGGEPAYDGDKVIGVTTSGSYGHTVGKSLAFVYVSPEYAVPETTFDIEILSHRRQAKVLAEPAYDPKNKRLRA